jgi:hypothetical protein
MPEEEMKQTVDEFDAKWMQQLDLEANHYMVEMDGNKDGHVSRFEFLNYHLKRAGFAEEQD